MDIGIAPMESNFIPITSGASLPHHLSSVIPLDIRCALGQAYYAAEQARSHYKTLQKNISNHLYRLCRVDDTSDFHEHCSAIDRLLGWGLVGARSNNTSKLGVTLTATAKIPSFVLRFHIDEAAYRDYAKRHQAMRESFFKGSLSYWRQTRRNCEVILHKAKISPMDKSMCWDWWNKFLAEVAEWESKLDDLVVPEWDAVLTKLSALVEERVDLGDHWAGAARRRAIMPEALLPYGG
ncbi:predicted protein [Uncinocarpus reesii 1704]|uniref:Uncharacterized protein n=1 Tax=Uncinocarpus reesii (strain UAMH 1704) TaxID=336963 RepID=C4JEG0_UNCRE|nr:uncharacterized protein UREG_00799 [Uncinocarpus reesii 1704]EEP75952.1 predicted protein [Uncinocarpus reesii 1704]